MLWEEFPSHSSCVTRPGPRHRQACTTISSSIDPCLPNVSLYLSSYFALRDSFAYSRPCMEYGRAA